MSFGSARRERVEDAVAAAGYERGSPRPRAVVLVLGAADRESISTFSAAQAQRYLSEVLVPLTVWRIGNVVAPEWPDGRRIATREDLRAAFDALGADVARQRIAWLETARETRPIGRQLAPRANQTWAPSKVTPWTLAIRDRAVLAEDLGLLTWSCASLP